MKNGLEEGAVNPSIAYMTGYEVDALLSWNGLNDGTF